MYSVTEVDEREWTTHIQHAQRVNVLQSWPYGTAKAQTSKWRAVRFLVRDEQSRAVALAQVLVRSLPVVGGAARMNRGPLLIGDVDVSARERVTRAALGALLAECRRRRWWVVQIAPELYGTESAAHLARDFHLQHLPDAAAASGLFSLDGDEEQLLMKLQGKWRNCLRKGWKLGVSVAVYEGNSPALTELLDRYRQLQEHRGFSGLPDSLIVALAKQTAPDWQFTLFVASEGESTSIADSIGMLVSIRHGDVSTYLIGSTNDAGRKAQANYVLLWRAVQHAKSAGCRWFDIGGLNATTPEGIAHFKQGLNAEPYELVGEWRGVMWPWKSLAPRE